MSTNHLDLFYLLHENPEPLRRADPCSCPAAGYDDPDSAEGQDVEFERRDGDGEYRGTETWSDYDRAYL